MCDGVSIIICCYNSAKRLTVTLEHIAKQEVVFGRNWELIIIDNASTDNTLAVAKSEGENYNLKLKIFYEAAPGLSSARKRGVKESLYSYVIFCDDDNWLFPDYLNQAFEAIEKYNFIGAIGGLGLPTFDEQPLEILNQFLGYFATGEQASSKEITDITSSKKYVYGAGAVFNKLALLDVYNNDVSLFLSDRKGASLVSGGDNELCYRLIMKGYKIFYNPNMKFYHYLPPNRLTKKYLLALNYSFGYSHCLLLPYLDYLNNIKRSRTKQYPLWLSFSLLKIFLSRHSITLFKNKTKINDIHLLMSYNYDLGMLISSFRNYKILIECFKFVRLYHDKKATI
jgi:glycosyltransferase involved in cell wall biosynthesis